MAMGVISRSPARPHLASLDDPRAPARAGRCREGGLSSTDERVMGQVTEVTQALWAKLPARSGGSSAAYAACELRQARVLQGGCRGP